MLAIREQRHPTGRGLEQDVAQALRRTRRLGQTYHQGETPATLDDLGDLLALDQTLQRRQDLRRGHAVLGGGGVVDAHLDLRSQHLLLDFKVGDARNIRQPAAQGIRLAAQGVQILAEDLDGDL